MFAPTPGAMNEAQAFISDICKDDVSLHHLKNCIFLKKLMLNPEQQSHEQYVHEHTCAFLFCVAARTAAGVWCYLHCHHH